MKEMTIKIEGTLGHPGQPPYVQVTKNGEQVVLFTVDDARAFALALLHTAFYVEADARLVDSFAAMGSPRDVLGTVLEEFLGRRQKPKSNA